MSPAAEKSKLGKNEPTGEEDLVTKGTGISEVLNPIFISVFSSKTGHKSGARELYSSSVEKNQVREHLNKLDVLNKLPMGCIGTYPGVL